MLLLVASFIAGVLTIAAPCILPLLPVIIGGSIARGDKDSAAKSWYRPLVIAVSLGVSVIVFTLLLRVTTSFIGVPDYVWQFISAAILLSLGVTFLNPETWDRFSAKVGLHTRSNKLLGSSVKKDGIGGDIAIGAALGPVFLSCSPTYLLIVSAILPASFWEGLAYLGAYAVGLAGSLLIVSYYGQRAVKKLGWLSNPKGWFYRVIGVSFIVIAVVIVLGWDKSFQAYVIEQGWYDPIADIEMRLR